MNIITQNYRKMFLDYIKIVFYIISHDYIIKLFFVLHNHSI